MPVGKINIEAARIELDYDRIASRVRAVKELGKKVVVTIGSWDMLHIGHVRYLIQAAQRGDYLIVGVDSDAVIKAYKKDPNRPIIPEVERMEMVSYIWCVDEVTLVGDTDEEGRWQYGLLRAIHPDVFVAVEDSYPEEQRRDIRLLSGKLEVLPRQAEKTSSTDIVQRVIKAQMAPQIAAQRRKKTHGRSETVPLVPPRSRKRKVS